jgi:hypothetical protein
VFRLIYGARPATAADCELLLRAIVPITSLRGRNQPRVFVGTGRRAEGWMVRAPGGGLLLVSESLLTRIRSGAVSDVAVSRLVAHAFGQVPARGSRTVLAVGVYCLPWSIVEVAVARIMRRLSRARLVSLSWLLRPVVFGLGLADAVLHARWEAAVPLVVVAGLTYTTGPLRRAWQRRLAELGDQRVESEALGPVSVLDRTTWVEDVALSEGEVPW